jgi:RNA polymerase sigma factor (TIGR02999 family)
MAEQASGNRFAAPPGAPHPLAGTPRAGEITELLVAARAGEPAAWDALFTALYGELRRIASWQSGAGSRDATLSTTALVHETYLKLVGARQLELRDRRHFFACAGRAMRQILVDHARAATADKRGAGLAPVELPTDLASPGASPDWIDLDRALDDLAQVQPALREIVELRYFAGLSREETAALLDCSERTVQRDWQRARAFLHARLQAASP